MKQQHVSPSVLFVAAPEQLHMHSQRTVHTLLKVDTEHMTVACGQAAEEKICQHKKLVNT
jgi:hypothetical protein